MLAVPLVRVRAGFVLGIGDRGDQHGDAVSEPRCQYGERFPPTAPGEVAGMILDRVVQQARAGQVRVPGPVMAEDPEGDPQQVAHIRLALAPVLSMQMGRQVQRVIDSAAVVIGEPGDLDRQPLPQASLAVDRRDRV